MLGQFLPMVKFYEHDANGNPLAGGKVYCYTAGTTPSPVNYKATYTDPTRTVANTNPVILDASGRAEIVLGSGAYKIKVTDSSDVEIYTVDNVTDASAVASGIIETVADLKDASYSSLQYALTAGYYSANDGGAALYYFNASSTATPNNGSVIIPNALTVLDPGRWLLVNTGSVNVRQFGAKGDGSTNDYSAINTANSYVSGLGGGRLLFTQGAYNFTSALTLSATVDVNFEAGAYLKSTNSSNLTINQMSDWVISKRFDSSIGTITFGGGVSKVSPEWFGALGDGVTDDYGPLTVASNSHKKIELQPVTYLLSSAWSLPLGGEIIGNYAQIKIAADNMYGVVLPTTSSESEKITIKRLRIINPDSYSSNIGLNIYASSFANLEDIYIENVWTGLKTRGGSNQSFNNISIKTCTEIGLEIVGDTGANYRSSIFNNIKLDGNKANLFIYSEYSGYVRDVIFNGLASINSTVTGAYIQDASVTFNALYLSGNATSGSAATINSYTVNPTDIHASQATVNINDSNIRSGLNSSVELYTNSVLNVKNFTGYYGNALTHYFVEYGSIVNEIGDTTAVGYREWLNSYGNLTSFYGNSYISYGVATSQQIIRNGNFVQFPQFPSVVVSAPATGSYENSRGLTRKFTIANSVGSTSANCVRLYGGTTFTKEYQITTVLFRSSIDKRFNIRWQADSDYWEHTFDAPAGIWVRHCFVTKNRAQHTFYAYPTTASSATVNIKDLMSIEGTLQEVSNVYQNGLVFYEKFGNYYSGAPTVGTWAQGDMVYDTGPLSTGYIGWVCVLDGTPGSWVTWGKIT